MSGVPAWAVRGAKVVCVNAASTNRLFQRELTEGSTYVIEWVGMAQSLSCPLQPSVRLVGVRRLFNGDVPFSLSRFRPLTVTRTEAEDIARFRHHLDQRQPERV